MKMARPIDSTTITKMRGNCYGAVFAMLDRSDIASRHVNLDSMALDMACECLRQGVVPENGLEVLSVWDDRMVAS